MVQCLNPQPGQTIYDPAMGTGGFLIGAYEFLLELEDSTASRENIKGTIIGIEKNPSTYLLGLMNALLHDIPEPNLQNLNTLANHPELRKQKHDIILANPPFGGKEQKSLADTGGFETKTPATEILFLQHFMDTLKATGKAAIVAPNGVLFGDGATLSVKKRWLEDFNVHTIVRLPNGVFSPYTDIPTNLIFFVRGAPTTSIWYYELPVPEGYKKFTKTKPLRKEHLEPLESWWLNKTANAHAWEYHFQTALQQARKDADPHQQTALQAEAKIRTLETDIKASEATLKTKTITPKTRASTETSLEDLRTQLSQTKELQRRESEKATSLLNAPYNLDRNHPDRNTDLQHEAPEVLLENVYARGERVLELIAAMRETLKNAPLEQPVNPVEQKV